MAIDMNLINSKYSNLLQSKLNSVRQKTKANITGYEQQKVDLENMYNNTINSLNNSKVDIGNKYKTLYSGLDSKFNEGKEKFYTQRNDVDTGVNQNLSRIQELMAKKGWLGGGANLQAQLSANTDRSNNLGRVRSTENVYNQDLDNTRNQYKGQETSSINEITNKINTSTQDKATKIKNILASIQMANEQNSAEEQALSQEVESQKLSEVSQLQELERQRVYQEQQAEKQRRIQTQKSTASAQSKADKKLLSTDVLGSIVDNKEYSLYQKKNTLEGYLNEISSNNSNDANNVKEYIKIKLQDIHNQIYKQDEKMEKESNAAYKRGAIRTM